MKIIKFLIASVLVLTVALSIYVYIGIDFSRDEELFNSSREINPTRFYYINENNESVEFYTIYNSGTKKEWLKIEEINPYIKSAFLSIEDRGFYQHSGVDIKRTLLAALNSIFHFQNRFGASTITQQLIKNISGDNEDSIKRKLDEIIRAFYLERNHTKDDIFELYLNIVPMGNGVSGISLASKYYFGKEQSELSLSEAALIAGITNAPARLNPVKNFENSIERRNVVLYAMLDSGVINKSEYEDAISQNIEINESREDFSTVYPWFVETVCNDFVRDYSSEKGLSELAVRTLILNGGLEFYTTMDPNAQKILEDYFEDSSNFNQN